MAGNNQQMSLSQCKEVVRFSLENSSEKVKLPVMLWGSHGVGKTEVVKQIAEEMGYNLIVLHLATQDIVDLVGIPSKVEVLDDNGNVVECIQKWSTPEWLINARQLSEENGKPNLFFLDEFNRGPRLVLAAMLPFLIEGTLHAHRIGGEDAVIAAANPPTEDYEVNDLIDKALLDRMAHAIFRPTHEEYIEYLKATGMDKTTIRVVSQNPEYAKVPEFGLDFEVTPSRRSIDHVMSVVGKKPRSWVRSAAHFVIEAYLGPHFRDEWVDTYSNSDHIITLEMIQNYDEYEDEITEALTAVIDGQETERVDVLGKVNDLIKQWIDDNATDMTSDDIKWMTKFFNNPKVPVDAAAAIFMANKHIKERLLDDADFAVTVMTYMTDKGIVDEAGNTNW
jgi:alkaline phosphatase D